ncbi:hypothetical protein ACIREE_36705 [Streptomyces sp. NPDC102467]|uniref:hypothetical protein n=1 Tax=Streptomyces sp. NPDC102467 TaxID=3366179 RepID=UPI00381F2BCB
MEELPSYKDTKGSMSKAALWLIEVVGEGNTFTKARLAEAFPNVAQIDRRVRELRKYGWRIETNREDPSLGSHEQRFVSRGDAVWEPGKRRRSSDGINAAQRRDTLVRDGNRCRSCGATPGQTYEGTYEIAQLDMARRVVRLPNGSDEVQLVTECNRCRVGGRDLVTDLPHLRDRIERLSPIERDVLRKWIQAGERDFGLVEKVWAEYQTLTPDSRDEIRDGLTEGD